MGRLAALWLALAVGSALAVASWVASAGAERVQRGSIIVSLRGGITPRTLPRDHRAPVAVHLLGGVQAADDSPLPRVNQLKLELAWRGKLDTHGLPRCPQARLQGVDTGRAISSCGRALVGQGRLYAKIFLPNQPPFGIRAHLLAFNGRTKVGRRAVLVHAYTPDPPTFFIIPFSVRRQRGAFRTVLVATIRRAVGTWPHIGRFRIDISRRFNYKGKRLSYLQASCPVPRRFSAGFLSFARATYSFSDDRRIKVEAVRSCRAR